MKVPDHVKWGGPVKRKVGSQADGAAWGSHAGVMERDFFQFDASSEVSKKKDGTRAFAKNKDNSKTCDRVDVRSCFLFVEEFIMG